MPVDPESLPDDSKSLRQNIVDLTRQLDKINRLVPQLIAARSGGRSEQLSADQLRLFAQELGIQTCEESKPEEKPDKDSGDPPGAASSSEGVEPQGRQALPKHLKRKRIVHDLEEALRTAESPVANPTRKWHQISGVASRLQQTTNRSSSAIISDAVFSQLMKPNKIRSTPVPANTTAA